jgi:hypothetical protein
MRIFVGCFGRRWPAAGFPASVSLGRTASVSRPVEKWTTDAGRKVRPRRDRSRKRGPRGRARVQTGREFGDLPEGSAVAASGALSANTANMTGTISGPNTLCSKPATPLLE